MLLNLLQPVIQALEDEEEAAFEKEDQEREKEVMNHWSVMCLLKSDFRGCWDLCVFLLGSLKKHYPLLPQGEETSPKRLFCVIDSLGASQSLKHDQLMTAHTYIMYCRVSCSSGLLMMTH